MTAEKLSPSELSYEEAINELDRLVAELDRGVVDVDTLSEQFKEAIEILEDLTSRIDKTRVQVDKLMPRLNSVGRKPTESDND